MRNFVGRFSVAVVVALFAVAGSAQTDCTFVATAANSGPYTAGDTINLMSDSVANATYSWSGPEGFTSNLQNPAIAGSSTLNSGTYTVVVDNGCSTSTAGTTVVVNPQPEISINNVVQKAPPKGSREPFLFTVKLSAPSTQTVTVEYSTSNQTAYAGKDYVATWEKLVFTPGTVELTADVIVIGTGSKYQKQFLVNLYKPTNATIALVYGYPSRGTGVIQP